MIKRITTYVKRLKGREKMDKAKNRSPIILTPLALKFFYFKHRYGTAAWREAIFKAWQSNAHKSDYEESNGESEELLRKWNTNKKKLSITRKQFQKIRTYQVNLNKDNHKKQK